MKNANLVSRVGRVFAATIALAFVGCGPDLPNKVESVPVSSSSGPPANYTYEVVAAWPHQRGAFTQGLVFHGARLLESTGMHGESALRELELETGRVVKEVSLSREFFGEGLSVLNGEAFQLTWQNRRGFVYDADTFRKVREFSYEGEGWGLTTDGQMLILSDGTNRLRFLDPGTARVVRTIEVTMNGKPVDRLNELEWIKGEIFANVWQTDQIVRIDPTTGRVNGVVNLAGLLTRQDRGSETDVLNGIAYDAANDRLFVTGKRWPKIFEVRLKAQP